MLKTLHQQQRLFSCRRSPPVRSAIACAAQRNPSSDYEPCTPLSDRLKAALVVASTSFVLAPSALAEEGLNLMPKFEGSDDPHYGEQLGEQIVLNPQADNPLITALFWLGVVLLIGITIGSIYLTYAESEDKKREKEERELFMKEVVMEDYARQVEEFRAKQQGKKKEGKKTGTPPKEPSVKGFSAKN